MPLPQPTGFDSTVHTRHAMGGYKYTDLTVWSEYTDLHKPHPRGSKFNTNDLQIPTLGREGVGGGYLH